MQANNIIANSNNWLFFILVVPKPSYVSRTFSFRFWALNQRWLIYKPICYRNWKTHGLGLLIWPCNSSFQWLIFALLEKLNSNWYRVSIPTQQFPSYNVKSLGLSYLFGCSCIIIAEGDWRQDAAHRKRVWSDNWQETKMWLAWSCNDQILSHDK